MSITLTGIVRSVHCGTGNKMFQFFTMVIYAEKHNLYLKSGPMFNEVKIFMDELNKNKEKPSENEYKIMKLKSHNFDTNDELKYYGKLNYTTDDFFQNANYINNNYQIIEKYTSILDYKKHKLMPGFKYEITNNDFLCVLRLGDLKGNEMLHPNFFLNIIKNNSFNNIYFMIYPNNDNDIESYLNYFSEYKEKIILINNNNKYLDFYCVNEFNHIAITTSTFNWWSIFFMKNLENKNIYTSYKFGEMRTGGKRAHVKNLGNIKNNTIICETEFISIKNLQHF